MNDLNKHLQRLGEILANKSAGYVAEAEACLAEIARIDDPTTISRLLEMLDESAPDELMFSIVHSVERWDDEVYCRSLLDSVESLWNLAPRWAQILHIRVMNSQSTSNTYFAMLDSAPSSKRLVVREIYVAIAKGWPKLAEKVTPILSQLGA